MHTHAVEPLFVSIAEAARFVGQSEWTIKQRLRTGIYRARKSGRRTLVEFESIKNFTRRRCRPPNSKSPATKPQPKK